MRRSKPTLQRELDDRRFRYRARFEKPPGQGNWNQRETVLAWLDARVGKGRYAWHEDSWEGHGVDAFALHVDDYAAIAEFQHHYAGIYLKVTEPPKFAGHFTRGELSAIRAAIAAMQQHLVERLDTPIKRVVWTMGRAAIPRNVPTGRGDHLGLDRINDLTPIDTALSVVPAGDETAHVKIEDRNRGSLEVGFAMWRDARPAPAADAVAAIRLLLDRLTLEAAL